MLLFKRFLPIALWNIKIILFYGKIPDFRYDELKIKHISTGKKLKKYHFVVEVPFEKMEEISGGFEETVESVSLFESQEKWFFEAIFHEEDIALVQNLAHQAGIDAPIEVLPDVDWLKKVHEDFPPLSIGKFYIYGSHVKETPPADLVPLLVDAATAFGSGHHESTFGCLTALSRLHETYVFKSALDMGCGSGILALGTASLWDCPVLGIDNDPEAVRVTIENAILNHKTNVNARVAEGFEGLVGEFDLITANILAGVLIEMAPKIFIHLNPKGIVVLAGLLATQADDVIKAYEEAGMSLVQKIPVGTWNTLVMERK